MKVLVTGAKGIVATELNILFNSCNISVNFLTRTYPSNSVPKNFYHWDPDAGIIDTNAFNGVSVVIHLAGSSIAEHNWSNKYKKIIVNSRVKSSEFLLQSLIQHGCLSNITHYISASAIGIYPDPFDDILTENSQQGCKFLAEVCQKWEKVSELWKEHGISVSVFRIGLVLSNKGGLLTAYQKPNALNLFPIIGNPRAKWSWIHINDLCRIFLAAVDQSLPEGTYNAVAPAVVDQKTFMRTLASIRKKRLPFFPPVPAFLLRIFMGERAQIITTDQNVSCQKLLNAGFVFKYPTSETALENLINESA